MREIPTRPVAQDIEPFRCEAEGIRLRWCRRNATRLLTVLQGDGYSWPMRMCTFHAKRTVALNSWGTLGEFYEVVRCEHIPRRAPGETP